MGSGTDGRTARSQPSSSSPRTYVECDFGMRGVPFLTLLGNVLHILQRLCNLVCLAMLYPRVELDGTEACTNWQVASTQLDGLAEDIIRAICRACLRGDCATVLAIFDVPNLHRFRELFSHVTTCLGGLRYYQDLL